MKLLKLRCFHFCFSPWLFLSSQDICFLCASFLCETKNAPYTKSAWKMHAENVTTVVVLVIIWILVVCVLFAYFFELLIAAVVYSLHNYVLFLGSWLKLTSLVITEVQIRHALTRRNSSVTALFSHCSQLLPLNKLQMLLCPQRCI